MKLIRYKLLPFIITCFVLVIAIIYAGSYFYEYHQKQEDFLKGFKGERGDKGETGAQGAQGPQGPQGPDGNQGPQGPQGPQGAQGAQGPIGLIGGTGQLPPSNSHIEIINGVKHHHYIVPDSEFKKNDGLLNNAVKKVYKENLQPTLMHQFIKKINPDYDGWICCTPSFNEKNDGHNLDIMTEIKHPPFDLVGIFFDKGTRFSGSNDMTDWDKYTFDEVIKATNGAENVYYFWRGTSKMSLAFERFVISISYIDIKKLNPELNKPRCPSFAKLLTQEDIDRL
ncbi:collagen-like protein [Candidatus Phytoplasma solani]|uniref:collagen-like triple helix repeat-containing protein n=1 Tax=Candidatus Phytoplasma solani TaxID=69896 RepID=UPI00358E5087